MALIEIKDFSYRYPTGDDFSLKNIDLSIEKGEFIAIVGANGSGKTTLCNAIRGFVPMFYKGDYFGQVLIEGEDIMNTTMGELAIKIGYIFQNPFNQISYIKETVFDEIAFGLENLGLPKEEIIDRIEKIIARLGIEALRDKNPFELSGGQQQRVALASILVMEPDILVIDEPTSQLDPLGTEQVFDIINLIKESGKTVILVEHKTNLIARYADKVAVMDGGRIKMFGPAGEVLANPEIEKYGVVMPSYARLGLKLKDVFGTEKVPITLEEAEELLKQIMKGGSAE